MKLGIRYKLILSQGLGLAFFILLAVISFYSISSYSSIHKTDIDLAHRIEAVGDLQLLLERSLMPPNDYLATGDVRERDEFAAIVMEMATLFEKVTSNRSGPAEEVRIGDDLKKGIIALQQRAMVLLSTENPIGNKAAVKQMKELDASGRLLGKMAEKLHARIRLDMEDHRNQVSRIGDRLITIFSSVAVIFLGGMIFLIFMVRRGISRPLDSLTSAVSIISSGNLEHRVDIKTGDEIETLGREFNMMAKSLSEKKTETREYVEQLERSNYLLDQNILRLYTLYNISKTLSSTVEAEKLLEQIVTEVQHSLSIHRISIMLVDAEHDIIYITAGVGLSNEAKKMTFGMQDSIYGWAAMTGEATTINNPSADSRFHPTDELDDDAGALVIAPFRGRGKVIGLLCAYKLDGEPFDRESFEMLTTISTQLGLTLENARLFDETRQLAITDGMTFLYNYRHFMECLAEEFSRAKRYKRELSLLMIDVDFFKKYNDTYGHQKGDEVLRGLADILKRSVRASDIVARYGGEEFVILLPETENEKALMLAERIRKDVESANLARDGSAPVEKVTVSIGVSTVDAEIKSFDDLMTKADKALYQAKNSGRNRVN